MSGAVHPSSGSRLSRLAPAQRAVTACERIAAVHSSVRQYRHEIDQPITCTPVLPIPPPPQAIRGNGRPEKLGVLGSKSTLLGACPVQIGTRRLLSTGTIKPLRHRQIDRGCLASGI